MISVAVEAKSEVVTELAPRKLIDCSTTYWFDCRCYTSYMHFCDSGACSDPPLCGDPAGECDTDEYFCECMDEYVAYCAGKDLDLRDFSGWNPW